MNELETDYFKHHWKPNYSKFKYSGWALLDKIKEDDMMLKGQNVTAFAGNAYPQKFFNSLKLLIKIGKNNILPIPCSSVITSKGDKEYKDCLKKASKLHKSAEIIIAKCG